MNYKINHDTNLYFDEFSLGVVGGHGEVFVVELLSGVGGLELLLRLAVQVAGLGSVGARMSVSARMSVRASVGARMSVRVSASVG